MHGRGGIMIEVGRPKTDPSGEVLDETCSLARLVRALHRVNGDVRPGPDATSSERQAAIDWGTARSTPKREAAEPGAPAGAASGCAPGVATQADDATTRHAAEATRQPRVTPQLP